MNTKQQLIVPFHLKSIDDAERTFEGHVSTSHLDEGNGYARDIAMPGSFKRTVADFNRSKDPYLPLLDSHDGYSTIRGAIGTTDGLKEELTGVTLETELESGRMFKWKESRLWGKWAVVAGNDGDEVMHRLRAGVIRKMSMGYRALSVAYETLAGGIRLRKLLENALEEASLVIFPMNRNADVLLDTVKRLEGIETLDDHQLFELAQAKGHIDALLQGAAPGDGPEPGVPAGLAAADPKRLELDSMLRDLQLRGLAE